MAARKILSGLDMASDVYASGVLSPSQITANQNDYAPTGHANAYAFRLNTDASRDITGLSGGAAGRLIEIYNVGSNNFTLKDESTSSSAGNRFSLPNGDLILGPDAMGAFWYDTTSSRWRLRSHTYVTNPSVGDQFVLHLSSFGVSSNVTRYYRCSEGSTAQTTDPSDSANSILSEATLIQRSGKITGLRARINAVLPASQTLTVTLMKNGTATALTCQLTDALAIATDLTNSIEVAAGDYVSWKVVTSATGGGVALQIIANFEPPASVFTFTKTLTLVKDSGLAARNYLMWAAPFACNVVAVKAKRTGGTGATINARKNGSSNHLSSNLSLTGTTLTDGGAVQNAAYAAGDELEGMLVSVTGTVTDIVIQVQYTIS